MVPEADVSIVLPSVFAYYMVSHNKWTRSEAGHFLLQVAFAWLVEAVTGMAAVVATKPGVSTGFIFWLTTKLAFLAPLANALKYQKFSTIFIIAVAIALFIQVGIWWYW